MISLLFFRVGPLSLNARSLSVDPPSIFLYFYHIIIFTLSFYHLNFSLLWPGIHLSPSSSICNWALDSFAFSLISSWPLWFEAGKFNYKMKIIGELPGISLAWKKYWFAYRKQELSIYCLIAIWDRTWQFFQWIFDYSQSGRRVP